MEIVTEGDVKVENVNDIGDLCNVSAKLSSTISNLEEFISK